MVLLFEGYPDDVVAYMASGVVKKQEYEKVVMRRVDEVAAKYRKINFIVLLQTRFENYTLAAFIDYLRISFRHFSKWNRMAIVSDQAWVRAAYRMLSRFVPGKIKSFPTDDYDIARKWVIFAD